jgi:two-component system, chemotaxis family, sensor kinase CheA
LDLDRAALIELFLSDSVEELARLEDQVLALEDRSGDAAAIDSVFRIAHTLKGNAAIVGVDDFAALAHKLEDVLHAARARRLIITGDVATLVLSTVDGLRAMLTALRAGTTADPTRIKTLEEALVACLSGPAAQLAAAPTAERQAVGPGEQAAGAIPEPRRAAGLRVSMTKIDQLFDLASRAVVVQGQIGAALLGGAGAAGELLELHQKTERLLLEIQDWVIGARMIPMATFFGPHARTVRDTARAQHKRVRLQMQGERVRVDTGIGETVRDVLTHLLRNAVDHGIEPPAVRAAQGKNPEGTITVRAFQNGNQVVIQVADDGAGLNLSKIRARARMLGRTDADTLSVEELHRLVFDPGFTTADEVSETSGRGVGMDAVRRSVEDLHGTVDVESLEGQGTTIELRLPLSLSVIEGFWVEAAGTEYVLPLDDVIECLDAPRGGAASPSARMVDLRGEPVACMHLGDVLAAAAGSRPPEQIVVVRHRSTRVGLGVDGIRGERQTVIKPLGRLFRSVPGISGSTMRPDGSVAFVIDVSRLLRAAAREGMAPIHMPPDELEATRH